MAWSATTNWQSIEDEALELFRQLLRVDTSNPPGNESAAAALLVRYLQDAGLRPQVLEKQPGRSNVVVRLEGRGTAPSLLLDSHLDTVPAPADGWRVPPFSAELRDGYVWGRGALDMKCMTAMSAAVMKAMAQRGSAPNGTLVLTATADEEAGSELGAEWLAKAHTDLIRCDYALGEVGGMSTTLNGRRVFPVQVAERGLCWMKVHLEGPAGHGAVAGPQTLPVQMAKLASKVADMRWPLSVHPTAAAFLNGIAPLYGSVAAFALRRIAKGSVDAPLWLAAMGQSGRYIRPMLTSSVRVTGIHSGERVNVVPSKAELVLDGRVLPGVSPESLMQRVQERLGPQARIEPLKLAHGMAIPPDNPMMRTIRKVIGKMDPDALVVPSLTAGHTNGSAYSTMGTRYLGFTPISMPSTLDFAELFHAPNERCPVEGFRWGVRTLAQVVDSFMEDSRI